MRCRASWRQPRAPDVLSFSTDDPGSVFASVSLDDIAALPQVAESGRLELPEVVRPLAVQLIVPVDDSIGRSFFLKKVLAGRLPDPHSATEAAISFTLADEYSLHVGDRLELDVRRADATGTSPTEHVSLSIVGIEASATEFPPQSGEGTLSAWTTPAFLAAHPGLATFHSLAVRLHGGGADVASYQSELTKVAAGRPLQVFALADQSVNTQRSIHLQAVSLWILAALLAGVGALVVAQLLSRQGQLEASEYSSLARRRGDVDAAVVVGPAPSARHRHRRCGDRLWDRRRRVTPSTCRPGRCRRARPRAHDSTVGCSHSEGSPLWSR